MPGLGIPFREASSLLQSGLSGVMKHLWSPWRMAYVEQPHQEAGCLFCNRLAQTDGVENLILHRGRTGFVILNRFPYTTGHMMVVPFAHQPSLELLDAPTRKELMELLARAIQVLRRAYKARAFNIGANIGEAAGAGVIDHVHFHVLPRWPGDTNFMTTTAETRVIPEALEDMYRRLRALWQEEENRDPRPCS